MGYVIMLKTSTTPNGSIGLGSSLLNMQSTSSAGNVVVKVPEPQPLDGRNWLIYYHYCRVNYDACKIFIQEELEKTGGKSEFSNYMKGMILRQEGKIQESLECFQKCFSLNSRSDDTLKQIARSLFLLGRQRLAMEAFTEARNISKKHEWDILHNLGLCMMNVGQVGRAKELFRQATELNRQEISYLALAKVCLLEADLPAAIAIYQTALESYPDSVDLSVSMAVLHMDLGDHQKAFEKFGTALALEPKCSKALLAVGALMQGHGELDVALAKYKTAAMHIPESASLWNNLGMCYLGKKRFVSAMTCLKRANALAPFDWKILVNLGLVHLSTQQYASAFHYFSSAINLDPNCSAVFLPLAVTLASLGDRKNARYAFEEAVATAPNSAAVAINFALFLLQEGDISGAATLYHRFHALVERGQTPVEPEVIELGNSLRAALQVPAKKESSQSLGESHASTSSGLSRQHQQKNERNFREIEQSRRDQGITEENKAPPHILSDEV